jgi:hypothetical protein
MLIKNSKDPLSYTHSTHKMLLILIQEDYEALEGFLLLITLVSQQALITKVEF